MKTQSSYPQYAEIDGKKYKINTDFRVAIKCNDISMDKSIEDIERGFAIIYLLFGDEALDDIKKDPDLSVKLGEKAAYYLQCGEECDEPTNEKPDMDFVEDMPYIEASFMSDYNINLDGEYMHWWKFYNLICGLSNSDFGNCCVLNRIRNLRTMDTSKIKDSKERHRIEDAKRKVALKRYKKQNVATDEQLKSANDFLNALGIGKE